MYQTCVWGAPPLHFLLGVLTVLIPRPFLIHPLLFYSPPLHLPEAPRPFPPPPNLPFIKITLVSLGVFILADLPAAEIPADL